MKRSNTIVENIEFLLSMYKRELSYIEKELEKISDPNKREEKRIEEEMIECYIDELETIIELSK